MTEVWVALCEGIAAAKALLDCKRAIENHPGCVGFVNAAAAEDDLLAICVQHDVAESRWLAILDGDANQA